MSRRRTLADPRRPVSPWSAAIALIVCLGIVGVISMLTPDRLPSVGYHDEGRDGIARTENMRVRVSRAYVTAAIMRDTGASALATTEGIFVVVEFDATFVKTHPSYPSLSFISRDGRTYKESGRADISYDRFVGYAGFTTHAHAVFEVPFDAVDGGRFVIRPEMFDGLQPYQSAARVRLPDPLPRAAGIVTLPKQTVEVAR